MTNSNISRVINSTEVQSKLLPKKENNGMTKLVNKNPLLEANHDLLLELNPFADEEKKILADFEKTGIPLVMNEVQ